MLVHADAVETQVLRRDELVEVPVVEPVAHGGVVELVGTRAPGRPVVPGRQLAVRHEVEREEPHRCTSEPTDRGRWRRGTLPSSVHRVEWFTATGARGRA